MNSKFVITVLIGLLIFITFLFFVQPEDETGQAEPFRELELPELGDTDYSWIASRRPSVGGADFVAGCLSPIGGCGSAAGWAPTVGGEADDPGPPRQCHRISNTADLLGAACPPVASVSYMFRIDSDDRAAHALGSGHPRRRTCP